MKYILIVLGAAVVIVIAQAAAAFGAVYVLDLLDI